MQHEFIKLDKNDIPETVTYLLKGDNEVIVLDDCVIVNNPVFLRGFSTYKVSLKNAGEGLDYHGNTIIPTSSLPIFIANLKQAKKNKEQKEYCCQITRLIQFCQQAFEENKYIVHFGL